MGELDNKKDTLSFLAKKEKLSFFAYLHRAKLILDDKKSVEVSGLAFGKYNEHLDAREKRKIYTDDRAQNFFLNKHGRSSVMCPFGPSELWRMLREQNQGDLIFS